MSRRIETLIWVGLFAAPVAFAFEHVFGWLTSEADCAGAVGGIKFTTSVAIVSAVSVVVAGAGVAASVLAYRGLAGTDNDAAPPEGRVWFMSICGIVVSTLLFIVIVLGGSGALLLGHCHQS